jgi:hypothetical protein
VKPESKLEIAQRRIAEAEAAIERQKKLIQELKNESHSTRGSEILLDLLEETAQQARISLATLRYKKGLSASPQYLSQTGPVPAPAPVQFEIRSGLRGSAWSGRVRSWTLSAIAAPSSPP